MSEQLQLVNGMGYKPGTQRELIRVLDTVRNLHQRVTLYFGEPTTGEHWWHATGYVHKSKQSDIQKPVLATYSNTGAEQIIETETIVRIEFANKKDGGELFRSK